MDWFLYDNGLRDERVKTGFLVFSRGSKGNIRRKGLNVHNKLFFDSI